MFGRKREERPQRPRRSGEGGKGLGQFGLFDIPSNLSLDDDNIGADDNDSDLEAELLALTSGAPAKPKRAKAKPPPSVNLDAMVAASLKDIPSDEEVSGDEDDPELLNELQELTGCEQEQEEPVGPPPAAATGDMATLLKERLQMYVVAEGNAKQAGESSRARRFNRAIKTLKDLIKQNDAGKAINPDDIPPEVSTAPSKKPSTPPAVPDQQSEPVQSDPPVSILPTTSDETPTKPSLDENLLRMLTERKTQYKIAALAAKKSGDVPTAVNFMKISKQFDVVIQAVERGDPVDLSKMPGPPNYGNQQPDPPTQPEKVQSETQNAGAQEQDGGTNKNQDGGVNEKQDGGANEEQDCGPETLITAGSTLEALEQRLQVYKEQEEKAKNEGNSSKARRMGRVVKQFETAIKQHKTGKPVSFEELPTPPGYAPIPVNPPPAVPQRAAPAPPSANPDKPAPSGKPAEPSSPSKPPMIRANSSRKMGNQVSNTHLEKQVAMLMARQREFKEAALQAKKKGEIAQAKELLKTALGFNKVIDAARGGFPVDMESLPVPPASRSILDESYEVIVAEECQEDDSGTFEMLNRLEDQLTKQLKMCLSTRDHHKALGDVTGVNRFENLALSVTKDLDVVRLAKKTTFKVPLFHYETKSFSIVKCCTDLNDNDFELQIVRGINYVCANPKEIDTYVKFEFPFPQEEPFRERTAVVKDTNNPEYNATFTIPIQRNSRPCQRVFKRHAIKLEVYSRGWCSSDWMSCFSGFFRSDQLIGTVQIKLQPLETQCELHDSYDLMDGRKKTGGKLEVKLRVRHPMVSRQMEQLNEKWLVLNH